MNRILENISFICPQGLLRRMVPGSCMRVNVPRSRSAIRWQSKRDVISTERAYPSIACSDSDVIVNHEAESVL